MWFQQKKPWFSLLGKILGLEVEKIALGRHLPLPSNGLFMVCPLNVIQDEDSLLRLDRSLAARPVRVNVLKHPEQEKQGELTSKPITYRFV